MPVRINLVAPLGKMPTVMRHKRNRRGDRPRKVEAQLPRESAKAFPLGDVNSAILRLLLQQRLEREF